MCRRETQKRFFFIYVNYFYTQPLTEKLRHDISAVYVSHSPFCLGVDIGHHQHGIFHVFPRQIT